MMKNIKIIVFLAVTLGILVGLHWFVFSPMKVRWEAIKSETETSVSKFRQILGLTGGARGDQNPMEQLPQILQDELRRLKTVVDEDRQNFDNLIQKYDIIDNYQKAIDYRDTLLQRVNEVTQLEESSKVTAIDVSYEWGVSPSLGKGKFGSALRAFDGHSRAYVNFRGAGPRYLNEKEGTVEFLINPSWDPTEETVKQKCLFLALGQRLYASMDDLLEDIPQAIGLSQPEVESYIAVYKGEGPTLVYEMRNWSGGAMDRSSTLLAYINDWKPDQWYHICIQWAKNRQALYINGSNKGFPSLPTVSIRSAVDMGEFDLGADYGFSMGGMMGFPGMMMGGRYGMMGGMYGMRYPGMWGGGEGGGTSRFASVAGQALTQNIAIPDEITGVYLGATETGEFAADAMIDEFRICNTLRTPSSASGNAPAKSDQQTTLIDHFDSEYPPPANLRMLLSQLALRQRGKSDRRNAITYRTLQEREYKLVQKALGYDTELLAAKDPTYNSIKKVLTLNYIHNNTQYPYPQLIALFEIKAPESGSPESLVPWHGVDNRQVYMSAEFVRLAHGLCQQAVKDKVIAVTRLANKGESYDPTDEAVMQFFQGEIQGKLEKLFPTEMGGIQAYGMYMDSVMALMRYGMQLQMMMPGGGGMAGGFGMGGMGMGGMGMPGMGMPMMGMPMMGMRGMGMGMYGMGGAREWMFNQETGDPLPPKEILRIAEERKETLLKVIDWKKSEQLGEIPTEVIERRNVTARQTGDDFYVKRSTGLEFEADVKSYAQYLHSLEYGDRVATINKLEIESLPDERLKVKADVEAHYVRLVEEEEEAAASTGPISLRTP